MNASLKTGWAPCRLGEVLTLVNGRAYKQPEMLQKGTPILRIQNLNGGNNWFYSDLALPKDKYCAEGDLLYAWSATFGPYIYQGPKAIFHYHIWNVLPSFAVEKQFAFYELMRITDGIKQAAHGVAMPHITKAGMENWELNLPPLPEQKRIADKLDSVLARVDACRDRLDRLPALLKRFRQSILAAAISGRLTVDWRAIPDEEYVTVTVSEPYTHTVVAPANWTQHQLGDVCNFAGGSQPPKSTFVEIENPDVVRLIQIRDYKSDKYKVFIPIKLARRFCNETDVMIGRYGPPIFQILRGLKGAYNVALMKAEPKIEAVDLEYLYYFLKGDTLLKYVEAGSDRTAGQDGVRKELLLPYPTFLPSLEEQHEIVRRVELLFAFADRLEARLAAARRQIGQLTPALLAKAFRGELVAQDPADEPAAELLKRLAAQRAAAPKAKRGRSPA